MAIVLYPDPALSKKAAARPADDALRAVGTRLLAARAQTQARGLAAAHIGEPEPVIVMLAGAEPILLFNPQVMAVSTETEPGPEGSVSLPGIELEVERPVSADVSWQDGDGTARAQRFEGIAARIALHEIDQMNGVFFLSRVSRLKREMALKKWKKLGAGR